MGLPSLSKTWQFNVNNQVTAQGTALADNRKILRAIKNAMIGFATNAWTVRYSCDSSVAGTAGDGVDRWAADSNLVWANAGSAHSWIVLRQAGISSTFEVLISCEGASGTGVNLVLAVSTAGFTGGSTTARPTATDENVLINAASWNSGTDTSSRWSVMQSSDGQCTRVIVSQSASQCAIWIFDKPQNPTSGWSNPYIALGFYSAGSAPANNTYFSTTVASAILRMRSGSTTGNCTFTVEGIANALPYDTAIGNIANEIDSSWDMWPLAFACLTTGIRGRHGSFFDLYMGSNSAANLDTYPNDGSNQFVQLFGLIFPWNGSTPALS
jgi:hypothetical protein